MGITHTLFVKDSSSGTPVPVTGVIPTVLSLKSTAGDTLDVALLTIAEIGNGWYRLTYNGNVKAVALLDYGASYVDRYQGVELPAFDPVEVLRDAIDADHEVTIQVNDATSGNPIPGVTVVLRNASDTATVAFGATNGSGQIKFNLDNDNYVARLYAVGAYTFAATYPFTISGTAGTPLTVTLTGTPITSFSPIAPSSLALCTLYGYVHDIGNNPIENALVEVELVSEFPNNAGPFTVAGAAVQKAPRQKVRTDSTGLWQIDLLKSVDFKRPALYRVRIDASNVNVTVRLPDAQTARLDDLL